MLRQNDNDAFFEHFDFPYRNKMISVDDFKYYCVSGQDDEDPNSSRYCELGRRNINRSEGKHQLLWRFRWYCCDYWVKST
ncbi:hypothetical protein G9A89_010692 [Geosiphon pyriformis]|nr:hypothetical protein G9A89_010692 [Geosiphon pyriformis]